MSHEDWIKLKFGNDWGAIYFAIDPLTRSGTTSHDRGIRLVDGAPVVVRWPDGAITAERVALRREASRVHDMGHSYDVASDVPHIEVVTHGVQSWVRLDEVEVRRSWAVEHGAK